MFRAVTYTINRGQYIPYFTSDWFADIDQCWKNRGFLQGNNRYMMIEEKNVNQIYRFVMLDVNGHELYKSKNYDDLTTCYTQARTLSLASDLFYTLERGIAQPVMSI